MECKRIQPPRRIPTQFGTDNARIQPTRKKQSRGLLMALSGLYSVSETSLKTIRPRFVRNVFGEMRTGFLEQEISLHSRRFTRLIG